MVGRAAALAHPPAGDAVEHDLGGHVEVDDDVERFAVEQLLELLGLVQVPGEAVEHEAVLELPALGELLLDHPEDDVVGDQLAGVHVAAAAFEPDGRALLSAAARSRSPVETCVMP